MLIGDNHFRIKVVSLSVITKFKAEIPEFDIDFDSFVKDLLTDETVMSLVSRGFCTDGGWI